MTARVSISDVARQHRSASITTALAVSDDFEAQVRPSRVGALTEAVASATRAGLQHLLAALHDSRRKQAAIELARHRDLIYDPETGIAFKIDWKRHS